MLNQEIPSGCLLNIGIAIFLFIFLGMTLPPGVALGLFVLYIIGYIVYRCVQDNKKLAVQRKQEEEQEKNRKQQEADYVPAKEELLSNILKWGKEGLPQISVSNPILNKNNKVFFCSENFFFKSSKNDFTKGTLLLLEKEVCFLSDSIIKNIPYTQTLKVEIGPFELKFTSKNSTKPSHFMCFSDDPYRDRLEVANAFAKWYLLNGFEINSFKSDLEEVLNFPMEELQKFITSRIG